MIDLNKAKNVFFEYIKNYDETESNISVKKYHSLRVMENAIAIAKDLKLSQEDIELAGLIGLLHDTARFEQWKRFNNFSDKKTGFDHGDEGAKILSENDFLRAYISSSEYDGLIIKAVRNHNKFKIEDGLNERELLHSKIIRDADKLDIFMESIEKMYLTPESEKAIENSIVSDSYYSQFMNEIQIKRVPDQTPLDMIISYVAFIYDINLDYSIREIIKENYVDRMIDVFDLKLDKAKKQVEEIKIVGNKYLEKRLGK